jgi:cytochrome P450
MEFPADPIACMQRLQREQGDYASLSADGQRLNFVFGPEGNHKVLSDPVNFHSRFFALRGGRNSPQRRLSSGLLSMNGEEHRRNRRLVMDAFSKRAVPLYAGTIANLTEDLLSRWEPGQTVDMNHEMTEFMLRVTSSILFGVDNPEMAYRIGRMTDHWVRMNHEVGIGAMVSSPELADRYGELLNFASDLDSEIAAMIELRRSKQTMSHDALSMLLAAHDAEGAITDEQLVGHTALLFAASHLTTAHTFAWTLFLLSQHPGVMTNLHGELETLDGQAPVGLALDRLELTERVIKESMRCLPASAYSQRVSTVPQKLGTIDLCAGETVIFSQFMTHHRADLYPEPFAFQPERWKSISPSPYAYLPFGAGPRMCIGAALGMLILKTALPMMLSKFKFNMLPYAEINGRVISTMLGPTTPVPMIIEAQDGRFEAVPVRGNIGELVELPNTRERISRAA